MRRHEALKARKGSGKSIIATARKAAVIIWNMLAAGEAFNGAFMVDRKLAGKAADMGRNALNAGQAASGQSARADDPPPARQTVSGQQKKKSVKGAGVTGKQQKSVQTAKRQFSG
jgi:hypothetical protein